MATTAQLQARIAELEAKLQQAEARAAALAEQLDAPLSPTEVCYTRQQLQDIFDNIPAVFYVKDLAGRYTLTSRLWRERLGLAPDTPVIGRTDAELFPSLELIEGLWDPHEKAVLDSGRPSNDELNGSVSGRPYFTSTFLLYDEQGKPYALCCSSVDITKRRQAEAEREELLAQLQDQARQMQHILRTVPEGVLLLDHSHRVSLANPVAETYLAVLAQAMPGDRLASLGGHPLAALLAPPLKGLWHRVESAGESPLTFEIGARAIEAGPQPGGWVIVIRDVTRETEIQRRVQQQDRLAAVGQLAAGIAHDFNNIVAVIVLYVQILLQTVDLPPKGRERLQTIALQARRATDLIEQILDFSRRSVMERQALDLVPFLKEQAKLLERALPEHIEVDLAHGGQPLIASADPTRIQQVILNLALNARDAMPEGGTLTLGLAALTIGPDDIPPLPDMLSGDWVRLTVADTGVGIPADVTPHIFEPFYTTKAFGEGTGLGLAQVYGIVKQHEGYIDLITEVGAGTIFTIYLPLLNTASDEPLPNGQALVRGDGETILMVEDNFAIRQALVASLELLGYHVLTAADGRQALEVWAAHGESIALVLSDVVMPAMGGIELFHALRQQAPALRFVLLTGHVLADRQEVQLGELKEQGLTAWIQKPPSLRQLAETVAQALGKS